MHFGFFTKTGPRIDDHSAAPVALPTLFCLPQTASRDGMFPGMLNFSLSNYNPIKPAHLLFLAAGYTID